MRSRFAVARPLLFFTGVAASVVVIEPAPIDLLLVGLVGWWLIYERISLPIGHIALGMAYVGMSAISQVIGGIDGVEFDAAVVRDLAIELYLVATLVCLTATFRRFPERIRPFVTGIVVGAVVVSTIFLILNVLGRVPDVMYRDEHRVRVSGLFKDPNVLGPFLILPILLLLFRNEIVRIPFARLAALPCLVVLSLTYSRGAYVAMFVALGVAVFAIAMRERITYSKAAFGVLSLLAILTAGAFVWSTAGLPTVEVETGRLSYQSYDDDRFSTLATAFDYIVQHPLGNGVRSFANEHGSNPHNLFLGKATDSGIAAGLIVVLVPLLASVRVLFAPQGHLTRFSLMIGAALVGNMVVSGVIYAHHWRHLFFLVAIALAITQPVNPPSPKPNHDRHIDLTTDALEIRRRAAAIGQRT